MSEPPARADLWLAREDDPPDIVVVGIPWGQVGGVAKTPLALRDRLSRFSTYHIERGVGFGQVPVLDCGNWPVTGLGRDEMIETLAKRTSKLPPARLMVFLGGDEGITEGLSTAAVASSRGLIRFTSKPNPEHISRELVGHDVVVIGTHTLSASAADIWEAGETGATAITNDQIDKEGLRMTVDRALSKLAMCESVHVSVDLDVLDSVYAPACEDATPGGLTTRQLGEAVRRCAMAGKVRSMDFVGVDADRDNQNLTVDAMAHTVLSAVAGYAER